MNARVLAGAVAIALVLGTTSPVAGAGGRREIRVDGPVLAYSSVPDNPVAGVAARVRAMTGDGRTEVVMSLKGFGRDLAGRTFGAHLHTGPCADGVSAGPHYTSPDADPSRPTEQREIWLDFRVRRGGHAGSKTVRAFVVAPGAGRSIVIHADSTGPDGSAGPRLGCIGLEF